MVLPIADPAPAIVVRGPADGIEAIGPEPGAKDPNRIQAVNSTT
jgi:hypothetical protein